MGRSCKVALSQQVGGLQRLGHHQAHGDDGHVAALVQPRPGALHVLAGDLFSQPPGTLVVGIEEFGGTALRPEKHPA